MSIALIVATDAGMGMAQDGKIPWQCSEDLKIFKKLTMGCPIIFGRKTWDSIGRDLPGRFPIVVTRDKNYEPKFKADVVNDCYEAMEKACDYPNMEWNEDDGYPTVFIGGGAEIYRWFLTEGEEFFEVDTVYMSVINQYFSCNLFFPFEEINTKSWALNSNLSEKFDFNIYKRLSKREAEIIDSFA